MEIKNKLEKFLIGLSSLFLMGMVVMGIKIQEDEKKLNRLGEKLNSYSAGVENVLNAQKEIMANREEVLDKIVAAPAPATTRNVTTKTVVPGKVVTQKVPVTSSKKTKSS